MKITLLTHERELTRPTNTGQLIQSDDELTIEVIPWQRTEPCQPLVDALQAGTAVVLTPSGQGAQVTDLSQIEHAVILDGTWQEVQKMWNKSDYLKTAHWARLPTDQPSRFTLRRNQKPDGLCTAECVLLLLQEKGMEKSWQTLNQAFINFINE